jgi:hypothetical protein
MESAMTEFPKENAKDKAIAAARAITKGAVGAVPVAGSFLSEIVDLLYRQPIEKRREDWLRDVADALFEIRKRQDDLTPEHLAEDPRFITLLHRATEAAVRTHQEEKRRLLRNAVVSAAMPTAPDLDKQLYFLRLVEELTINQVIVMVLYRNPNVWFQSRKRKTKEFSLGGGRDAVVEQAYPELYKSPDFKLLVLGDLEKRGLLFGLSAMVSGGAVYDSVTTPIANEFLDFVVADPEIPKP